MPGEELLGLNEWNYSFSFLPAKDVSANILYARSESLLPLTDDRAAHGDTLTLAAGHLGRKLIQNIGKIFNIQNWFHVNTSYPFLGK